VKINENKLSDHTKIFQEAFNNKTGKALKIIISKGNYRISNTIETTRPNTYIYFEKGSTVYLQNNQSAGFIFKNDNIRFSNAKIIGNGVTAKDMYSGYGIMLFGANHCLLENNEFSKISGINILFYPNKNKGCSNNTIYNNKITAPAFNISKAGDEAGIMLGYSGRGYTHNDNLIANNNIDGNNILKLGIAVIGHGRNNEIKNNIVSNCIAYGITAYESEYGENTLQYTKIIGNKINNIGEIGRKTTVKGMGIYLLKSLNSTVEGNTVSNAMKNSDKTESLGPGSISISVSPNTSVKNNIVTSSGMYGIVSDYSFNSVFEGNQISNTAKSGMYFINMNNVIVRNNTFSNIGDVVIKGFFEPTKQTYIREKWIKDEFYDVNTGMNFTIKNNKFNTSNQLVYFYENQDTNMIKNNNFEDNVIPKGLKKANELVKFGKSNSLNNKINNNK
jgi:parallel beta-helix repeat protein